jgi:transposase
MAESSGARRAVTRWGSPDAYFVFGNRSSQRVKILWWDKDGLAIFYKRLERGTFRFPAADDQKAVAIDSAALMRLLSGMELTARR